VITARPQAPDFTPNVSDESAKTRSKNCSKKIKKSVDDSLVFCHSDGTHGKTQTTNMRKTLLCAAVIAAGAFTVMAQNVYSLNIVGYVNVPVPSGYSILANPLSAGVTNGANEIMPTVDGSFLLLWENNAYGYYGYDSGFGGWIDANLNPISPPELPPGVGFFYYNPGSATTVTFVGQVVPDPGVTNSMALPAGYSLAGTPMPVSGTLGGAPTTGDPVAPGTVNMPIIDGEFMLKWNGQYNYFGYDSGFGGWIDANLNPIAAPTVNPGEGFFYYNPGSSVNWLQALP